VAQEKLGPLAALDGEETTTFGAANARLAAATIAAKRRSRANRWTPPNENLFTWARR